MRKFLLMVCLVLLLLLDGLPLHAESNVVTAQYIRPERLVRVAVTDTNYPFVFQRSDGSYDGIFIDITEYVAEQEGWQLEWVPGTWSQGLARTSDGEVDLMLAVAHSGERSGYYDYPEQSLLANWGCVFVAPRVEVDSMLDLAGKRVAVVRGDLYADRFGQHLESFHLSTDFQTVESYGQLVAALETGQADAGVMGRIQGYEVARGSSVQGTGIVFSPVELSVVTKTGTNADLLAAYDRHLADKDVEGSSYDNILSHWLNSQRSDRVPPWIKWFLWIVGPLAAAGIALAGIFRWRAVQHKQNLVARTREVRTEQARRRKTARKLAESRARFEALVAHMREGAMLHRLLYDEAGRPIDYLVEGVNPAFERIMKKPREELVGKKAGDVYAAPGDPPPFLEEVAQVVKTGKPVTFQNHYWINDAHYLISVFALGDDRFGTVLTDVTELQRLNERLRASEARYRLLFDNVSDVIARIDREMYVCSCTPSVEKLVGLAPEDVIGLRLDEIPIGMECMDPALDLSLKKVLDEGATISMQTVIRDVHGAKHDLEAQFSPVRQGGEITGALVVVRDLTEQREAERQREQVEAQLRRAQRLESLAVLAGEITRLFKEQLTSVAGNAELALDYVNGSDELRRILSRIEATAERGSKLLNDLLLFTNQKPVEYAPVQLNEVILGLEQVLDELIAEDIGVQLELSSSLWQLRGDASEIEQAIMNLALRARAAMPDGGTLRLHTQNVVIARELAAMLPDVRAGRFVCLKVNDTGISMTPDEADHVFDLWPDEGRDADAGLAMATLHNIVRRHGGWLQVNKAMSRGTEFVIYWPALPEEQAVREGPAAYALTGSGQHVLLVEDDDQVRAFTADALEAGGYRVSSASDVRHALMLYRQNGRYDLLFSDLVLPDGNGIDLVSKLQREGACNRVVLTSAYADDPGLWGFLQEHRYLLLRKPYRRNDLLRAVHDALQEEGWIN